MHGLAFNPISSAAFEFLILLSTKKILQNNNFLCQKGMESVALHNQQVFNGEERKYLLCLRNER